MWQASISCLAALVALGLSASALAKSHSASKAPRALASNGAVVAMPEISGLDCDGMSDVLRRIDISNYRGPFPIPEGHPDWPIFEYEDRLTKQYYLTCTLGDNQLEDPGAAFSFGFESQ
jgi:hypothetical protein